MRTRFRGKTAESIAFFRMFEELVDYYIEREGDGDVDAGWDRLRNELTKSHNEAHCMSVKCERVLAGPGHADEGRRGRCCWVSLLGRCGRSRRMGGGLVAVVAAYR